MGQRFGLVLLVAAGLLFGACGGDEGTVPETGSGAESDAPPPHDPGAIAAVPNKAGLITVLRDMLAAIEAGDAAKALGYLAPPKGMKQEDGLKAVMTFVEKREISAAGIDRLAAEGKFGFLDEVFKERGIAWAERADVDIAKCYGLALEDAQVAAFWTGDTFKVIRVDDVGKLK